MGKRQNNQVENWLIKIADHQFDGLSLRSWVEIVFYVMVFLGILLFLIFRPIGAKPEFQTIIAEVTRLWVYQYDTEGGSVRENRAYLREGEQKYVCIVPDLLASDWLRLRIGQSYEFHVSVLGAACSVKSISDIE